MTIVIDSNSSEQKLIDAFEEISTKKLRSISHPKYVSRLTCVVDEALKQDGTRLLMLIGSIKNCPGACYKRDLLLDVLQNIVLQNDGQHFCRYLLCHPFPSQADIGQVCWKELANAIVSIPELVSNCNAQTKLPQLSGEPFDTHLCKSIFSAIEQISTQQELSSNVPDVQLCYFVQLLGRLAFRSQTIVWLHVTLRAIQDNCNPAVKSLFAKIMQLPLKPELDYESLEVFTERLCMPLFLNLKPTARTGVQIKSLLGSGVLTSEHLNYLICNKYIFKINYTLDKQQQAVILFNISAYLASLVNHPHIPSERNDLWSHVKSKGYNETRDHTSDTDNTSGKRIDNVKSTEHTLLIQALLNAVANWSSHTKVLMRTYEHSLYITKALLILFRHALEYEHQSVGKLAAEIQSNIAVVIPTYLNRASQVHRNLAIFLGKLLFPQLRELMNNNVAPACGDDGRLNEAGQVSGGERSTVRPPSALPDFELDWSLDMSDDLIYLQSLFQTDQVEEIFRDFTGPCQSSSNHSHARDESNSGASWLMQSRGPDKDQKSALTVEGTAPTATVSTRSQDPMGGQSSSTSGPSRDRVSTTKQSQRASGKLIVELDDAQSNEPAALTQSKTKSETSACRDASAVAGLLDDDSKPHALDVSDVDDNGEEDDDDDDELAGCATTPAEVPIYLRDCIEGLIENNNRRYVRLCLMRAGELIDRLILQDEETNERQMADFVDQRYARALMPTSIMSGTSMTEMTSMSLINQKRISGILKESWEPSEGLRVSDTLRDVGVELARTLLFLDNQFNIENFQLYRLNALTALCCAVPQLVAKYLIEELNEGSTRSLRHQLDILQVLVASAERLSRAQLRDRSANSSSKKLAPGRGVGYLSDTKANGESVSSGVVANPEGYRDNYGAGSRSSVSSANKCLGKQINMFSQHAPLYFYGVVYRLKADFVAQNSPMMAQPASIVSAFRRLKCQPIECADREDDVQNILATLSHSRAKAKGIDSDNHKRGEDGRRDGGRKETTMEAQITPTAAAEAAAATAISIPTTKVSFLQQQPSSEQKTITTKNGTTTTVATTTTSPTGSENDSHHNKPRVAVDGAYVNTASIDKFLERNSLADDSHLLSKILLASALIIRSASQQPVVCRLANDLLDVLAAYRCHPDPGVRATMLECMRSIRDCTPSVYFSNFLEKRMLTLFGPWLASQ